MKLGIIGGSGLYDVDGLDNCQEISIETPFGNPSDVFMSGSLNGSEIVFLPRHGRGHTILPHELNHQANIFAMKQLGVSHIVSFSAVGSLREDYKPRDIVIVDQFFDRTKRSGDHTFFGNGVAGHISFAEPICGELAQCVQKAAREVIEDESSESAVHMGASYVNIEGPAFSTKVESKLYKSWGLDIIGMTNIAEAKLAREAEIHYSTVAMVTDYDCWHEDHYKTDLHFLIQNLMANTALAKLMIPKVVKGLKSLENQCSCDSAAKFAIVTQKDLITLETVEMLETLYGREI